MKKHRRSGIFSQIWASFAAICVFVVLLAGCICFFMVRRFSVTDSINDLSDKAWTVSQIASQPAGITRLLNRDKLYEIEKLTDAQLIYVDRDMNARRLSVSSEYALPEEYRTDTDYDIVSTQIIDSLDKALIGTILEGRSVAEVRRLSLLNTSIVLCGAPVFDLSERDVSEVTGAVILWRPVEDVWSSAAQTLLVFAAAACIAVLLSLVLAWWMSTHITRPVLALGGAARRIAEGDYSITKEEYGAAELDELGETLNSLSSRLNSVVSSLSNEKSKLEQILRGIGEGIIAVDQEGHVLHHNAAALDLMGISAVRPQEIFNWDSGMEPLLRRALAQGGKYQTDWKLGDGRQISANVYPVYDEYGEKSVGAVALMRDVSESARLEQMRRDYIANISHELRTPLTGIRGMVEPLIDGVIESEEERQDCYRIIYQETVRLQKLIGDMLDMSRLQDGKMQIALESLDITAICANVCERMHGRSLETGVRLETALESESMFCMGNEDRIVQVLVILLDNAFSFTPTGGCIRVFLRREGRSVAFGVQDNGAGIDPKDLPYIWERFFKADRSRMRTSGTGLGLAIAKMAVELMGGEIGVESMLGAGSTFTVRLPVSAKE